jgi:hypothetical protein
MPPHTGTNKCEDKRNLLMTKAQRLSPKDAGIANGARWLDFLQRMVMRLLMDGEGEV